jgi:succinoglycan biosynthesis protein ExoV
VKLFYYQDAIGNFGDDLNAWLWPQLIPELLGDNANSLLIGIGSILDSRIPEGPTKVVFGTGVGYGRLPPLDDLWRICCVRGPLTASALGLPAELAITDAAALVRTLPLPPCRTPTGFAFMPHFRTPARAASQGVDIEAACGELGIRYINPSGGVERVLSEIRCSEVVIAEAMHGAIVADALGVPWVPVQLYSHILALKWWDWCASLKLTYNPVVYPQHPKGARSAVQLIRFLRKVTTDAHPMLSNRGVLDDVVNQLQEHLQQLKSSHGAGCFPGSAQLTPNPEVFREIPWLYAIHKALEELAAIVLPGESFILVDDQQWGGGEVIAGRHVIPFLERDGHYWGPPPDDETAIRELDRLRSSGVGHLAFAWTSFWWLDHYEEFTRHLRSSFPCPLENERLVIFRL